MSRNRRQKNIERYELQRSPLAQRPTQREVAVLVGETRDDLRRLINYKEEFIVRRQEKIGKKQKVRDLKYPISRLRGVHERLKFHLNKIKQPSYLFSPRKNRGQRDNASLHLNQNQYLTLDLKQFYPSTTSDMIFRWFRDVLGMYEDVAGLLTHLCTIDDQASFGSPLTPVLCTLVHQSMNDKIADLCDQHGLRYSVWVDDLTISGQFVPGIVVKQIRDIIRQAGLRSHKIRYRTGNRPVFITGIGIVGSNLIAPNSLNLRIKELFENLNNAETVDEKDACFQALLSNLGTVRHITGANSDAGKKAADQMNSLRQKREKMNVKAALRAEERRVSSLQNSPTEVSDCPFDL